MESGCGESKPKIDGAQWSIYAQPGWLARLSEKRRREQPDVPGGRAKMDNLSCSTRRAGLRPIGARAGFCNRTEVWTILTAGVFCACSPAAVQADPDPCTGVGVVTCSGNQSLGVLELTPGTTVLNVNSLTSTIAPPVGSGVPGILFFGSGDLTLNSATGPFGLITSDDFVDGIVVQSDGGIKVTSSGNISTTGLVANGINLLSFSGGTISLTSSSNISLAQGGDGLLVYSDGTVSVASTGAIAVTGDGSGINATAGNFVSVTSSGPISITGNGDAIDATDIGGSSAGGGVVVNSSGAISLAGNGAIGINASSEAVDPVTVMSSGAISLANGGIGISASGSGDVTVNSSGAIFARGSGVGIAAASGGAGTVTVTSSSNIAIEGGGVAIVAASGGGSADVASSGNLLVSGGTGIGITAAGETGATVSSSGNIVLSSGGAGIAAAALDGTVTVTSSSNVTIGGDGVAIAAASDGGAANVASSGNLLVSGTGFGISAIGGTGTTVSSSGNITAAGAGSTAILATAGSGDIAVKIAGGTLTGGSGSGAGVALAGGGNNTITNFGTITTSAGLAGTAILGKPSGGFTGNEAVMNSGTIIGNVDLGPGRNVFNNLPGGVLNSGASINVGAGNALVNSGVLSPGGAGLIQTTTLTGNLVQGAAGRLVVDVNPATRQADRLNVTGSANLGGQVSVNLANAIPTSGLTTTTIVHADGGAADNGLALAALPAVASYSLEFPDANDVVLQGRLNFAPTGLNSNQTSIGQNINAIQIAGGSASFGPVVQAILSIPTVPGLGQAYDALSPEAYGDNEIADFYSALRFANSMMSCKVPDGRYVFIKEGQCAWAQIGGNFLDLNSGAGHLGFNEDALVMSGGAEITFRPDWFASFALGYDHGSISTGNTAQSQANRAHVGAAIKYNPGPFLFSAAVYGGYGWYNTDRFINFADFNETAFSDSGIRSVGGQVRAAYLVDRGSWYLKPLVDLNVTRVALNGFSEQGAGGASLNVSGAGKTIFSASPAVEIGTQTAVQNGALMRLFARVGVSAFSNTDFPVYASFSGAPIGVAPFGVATAIDPVTADVAAGADLFLPGRWALKLSYNGRYGERVRDQGFTFKASLGF